MSSPWPGTPITWSTAMRNAKLTVDEWRLLLDVVQAITDSLGVDPLAGDPSLDARLDRMEELLAGVGEGAVRNLRIDPVTTGTDWRTQVAILAEGIAIQGVWVTNVNIVGDLTVSGKNGLDAGAGTEAADTWYAIWLGVNPDTLAVCMQFSTSFTLGGLVLGATVDGFTNWRRIGARRNGPDGHFFRASQQNEEVLYDHSCQIVVTASPPGLVVLADGTGATNTAVALDMLVPPASQRAYVGALAKSQDGANYGIFLYPGTTVLTSSDAGPVEILTTSGAGLTVAGMTPVWIPTDDVQAIKYRVPSAAGGNAKLTLSLLGYADPI